MNQEERLEQEVGNVLKEYVAAKKQFTAVDVGNELKKKGINVRQREVSPLVRQLFSNGDVFENTGYTRTMIDVKGGNEQSFLYFSIDTDPTGYTQTNQEILKYDPNKPMFADTQKSGTVDDKVDGTLGTTKPQAPAAATQGSGLNAVIGQYVASVRSKVMHGPNCMYSQRIKPENKVSFDANDPKVQDYRACKKG
jgi:hypothetical protein